MNAYATACLTNAESMIALSLDDLIKQVKELASKHDISYADALNTLRHQREYITQNMIAAALFQKKEPANDSRLHDIHEQLTNAYTSILLKRLNKMEDTIKTSIPKECDEDYLLSRFENIIIAHKETSENLLYEIIEIILQDYEPENGCKKSESHPCEKEKA